MSRHRFALCLLGSCLALTPAVRADDFSWELAGAASVSELDPLLDTDRSSLQATYYLGGVDDSQGPYALASFFDPKTRVGVSVAREKQTSHPIAPPVNLTIPPFPATPAPIGNIVAVRALSPIEDFVTETDDYAVNGRYVLPDSKWYFGGSYEESDFDNPLLLSTLSADADAYSVLAGKYFGDATTLELAWHSSERRTEQASLFCAIIVLGTCVNVPPIVSETETDQASVAALHVRRFRSLTYALSGRVAQTSGHIHAHVPDVTIQLAVPPGFAPISGSVPGPILIPGMTIDRSLDRFETYSVGAEFFPTAKLGVRVGYADWSSDAPTGEYAYDVATTWFFRRSVGLQFAFSRERAPDDSNVGDNDTVAFRVIGRL